MDENAVCICAGVMKNKLAIWFSVPGGNVSGPGPEDDDDEDDAPAEESEEDEEVPVEAAIREAADANRPDEDEEEGPPGTPDEVGERTPFLCGESESSSAEPAERFEPVRRPVGVPLVNDDVSNRPPCWC